MQHQAKTSRSCNAAAGESKKKASGLSASTKHHDILADLVGRRIIASKKKTADYKAFGQHGRETVLGRGPAPEWSNKPGADHLAIRKSCKARAAQN